MRVRPGIAVDLGTVNTLISVTDGPLLDEPSAIAVLRAAGTVTGAGREADALAEKEPLDVEVIHPVRDGVIADYEAAVAMLAAFGRRAGLRRGFARRPVIVGVPGAATSLERRTLAAAMDAAFPRGALQFVDKPVLAAVGAGLDLAPGSGAVIVDIGGGTTEVAVLAGGHVVRACSLRVGGNAMDAAITRAIRARLGLLVGRDVARKLKMTLGLGDDAPHLEEVVGVDAAGRAPRAELVPGWLVSAALGHAVTAITGAVRESLSGIPPSLAEDVVRGKIRLAGGGALMPGLAGRIELAADIPAYVVDDPQRCVIRGAAELLADGAQAAARQTAGLAAAARVAAG